MKPMPKKATQTSLVTRSSSRRKIFWVTVNFKETQVEHMRAGQPVEIKVDAYGRSWKAHVTNLGGGTGSVFSLLPPENATGNYVKVVQRVPVRIEFRPLSDTRLQR